MNTVTYEYWFSVLRCSETRSASPGLIISRPLCRTRGDTCDCSCAYSLTPQTAQQFKQLPLGSDGINELCVRRYGAVPYVAV